MKTLVIGACNIDIIGTSKEQLIKKESNIGMIKIASGGVAKNIAENLFNLGLDVSFLTLVANDSLAMIQKNALDKIGIDYHMSLKRDVSSSVYLSVNNASGDMDIAVNDMHQFEALVPKDFFELDDYISSFETIVFDTNLSKNTLCYLIEKYQDKRIYVDGVSQSKVIRLEHVLKYIDLLKINQYELNALLKKDNCDIIFGINELTKKGLKKCLVSSANGPISYNIEKDVFQTFTQEVKQIKSTMGAGDALFSGTIFYLLKGKDMHKAVNFGKIVATKTMEVYEACNSDIKKLVD